MDENIHQESGQDIMPISETEQYISPTLLLIEQEKLPNPHTICQNCPKSIWFLNLNQLQCFCTQMSSISWSLESKDNPIKICDGQILGLMELNGGKN